MIDRGKDFTIFDLLKQIKKLFEFALFQYKIIFTASILAGLIGILVAWLTPITYTSKVNFVLEEGKGSASGLSAIAGQFGLDLNSATGGSSNLFAGDNIIGLLKSNKFTKETLLTVFDSSKNSSLADKFAEVYDLINKWEGNKNINKKIFFPPETDKIKFSNLQDSLLQSIAEKVNLDILGVERVSKKMSFFEVSATFRDEKLANFFTERLVNRTISFYIETKTRRQRSNVDRLQKRADSISNLLNLQTFSAASEQSRIIDINPVFNVEKVRSEISFRDKTMLATIFTEVVKNLEIQKATLTQETPLVQIIDATDFPLKKNKKSKLMYLIIFGVIGFIFTILILLFINQQKEIHNLK